MKKLKLISVLMVMALFMVACGGKADKKINTEVPTAEQAESIDDLLQGTWSMMETDSNGNSVQTSAVFTDGKVEIYQITGTSEQLVSSGTYTIGEDKIYLYYDGSDQPTELTYTYEDGALTLNDGTLMRK